MRVNKWSAPSRKLKLEKEKEKIGHRCGCQNCVIGVGAKTVSLVRVQKLCLLHAGAKAVLA